MEQTLQILERFLALTQVEVEGRVKRPVPPELERQLQALAEAQAGPDERARLALLLKDHPEWVAHLAEQIKMRRPPERTS